MLFIYMYNGLTPWGNLGLTGWLCKVLIANILGRWRVDTFYNFYSLAKKLVNGTCKKVIYELTSFGSHFAHISLYAW